MGHEHASIENLVHFDMIEAVGLDLYELDARARCLVDPLGRDISAQIDNDLDVLKLRLRRLAAIEHPHIVIGTDGRQDVVSPRIVDVIQGVRQVQDT